MARRIYTRGGDNGYTTLADGTRTAKTDTRIEAIGALDELNANIGLLLAEPGVGEATGVLEQIQCDIFAIGDTVGGGNAGKSGAFSEEKLKKLEAETDKACHSLPPLNNFVMPRGNRAAALCHVCRTVCRRAERRLLAVEGIATAAPAALRYINRLSDYLFALSRKLNNIDSREEKILPISCG